ncbi:hypothetical protein ACHAW5_001633 [Stephanodiscus triporus]|uniref:Pre-mRNA-splicing factor 38 n=1 Tax=Stephanodiscus triporus TaxID=2934178 RepID=A0ABD3PZW4_9STRA
MANVTDPLARSVHGTNPQNLIEYITRQKIYDSLYWKEECFGLSASDVASKATELRAIGGSYGGNNRPTRFLCLALKLLQIQPEDGIITSFIENEDFKYVRALGAFYLRLTGRPSDIYEHIEPLYNDFRKLRTRESSGWNVSHVDEFAHELLTSDRCCGIALPHLPNRDVLVSSGYLDGPRRSALAPLIEERAGGDAEVFLISLAEGGNVAAREAMDDRRRRRRRMAREDEEDEEAREEGEARAEGGRGNSHSSRGRTTTTSDNKDDEEDGDGGPRRSDIDHRRDGRRYDDDDEPRRSGGMGEKKKKKGKSSSSSSGGGKDEKKYGSLFKRTTTTSSDVGGGKRDAARERRSDGPVGGGRDNNHDANAFEGSEDYWNEQRAKLGLKPLKG